MAKSGTFRCAKCQRTFSMAAHLGRHMATIHGAKSTRAKATHAGTRGRPLAAAGGCAGLLDDVRSARDQLASRQTQLAAQVAALDELLESLGGSAAKPAHRRSPTVQRTRRSSYGARDGSLKSYIDRVLRQARKPMRVVEITSAVRKAGFKTTNKTLAKTIGNTLPQMPTVKKVERGVFKAK